MVGRTSILFAYYHRLVPYRYARAVLVVYFSTIYQFSSLNVPQYIVAPIVELHCTAEGCARDPLTTFESTLRSEVTATAQVSSAEDSSMSTVKARACAGRNARARDRRRAGESRRAAACCMGGVAEKDCAVEAVRHSMPGKQRVSNLVYRTLNNSDLAFTISRKPLASLLGLNHQLPPHLADWNNKEVRCDFMTSTSTITTRVLS